MWRLAEEYDLPMNRTEMGVASIQTQDNESYIFVAGGRGDPDDDRVSTSFIQSVSIPPPLFFAVPCRTVSAAPFSIHM